MSDGFGNAAALVATLGPVVLPVGPFSTGPAVSTIGALVGAQAVPRPTAPSVYVYPVVQAASFGGGGGPSPSFGGPSFPVNTFAVHPYEDWAWPDADYYYPDY